MLLVLLLMLLMLLLLMLLLLMLWVISTYPDGFFLDQSRLLVLLGLLLEVVVGHGDDGQNQVEEVEGSQEDGEDEKEHVPRSGRAQHQLVQILPVILHHETERVEHGPTEAVKTRVPIIRVGAVALQARVVLRTRSVWKIPKRKKKFK